MLSYKRRRGAVMAFASVRNQAEQALARPLTIRAADQTFTAMPRKLHG